MVVGARGAGSCGTSQVEAGGKEGGEGREEREECLGWVWCGSEESEHLEW